jgi:hypothetical protein
MAVVTSFLQLILEMSKIIYCLCLVGVGLNPIVVIYILKFVVKSLFDMYTVKNYDCSSFHFNKVEFSNILKACSSKYLREFIIFIQQYNIQTELVVYLQFI